MANETLLDTYSEGPPGNIPDVDYRAYHRDSLIASIDTVANFRLKDWQLQSKIFVVEAGSIYVYQPASTEADDGDTYLRDVNDRVYEKKSAGNLVGEVSAADEATTLGDTDKFAIVVGSTLKWLSGLRIWETVQSELAAATGKTTPVDADSVAIVDSAASNVTKRVTFANLWTWVKAKLVGETIYVGTGASALDARGSGDTALRLHGDSFVAFQFESYRNASSGHARFQAYAGRGTEASPSQTLNGDGMFWIASRGVSDTGALLNNDSCQIRFDADGNFTATSVPGKMKFGTVASGSTSVTERMSINSAGKVQFNGIGTTASAANAFLDSGDTNNLLRSTSSLKYKKDVETADPQYSKSLLDVRGIYYRSVAKADNPEWAWWGFAAEEVAEIDPRMVHWGYGEDDYDLVETEVEPAVEAVPAKKGKFGRIVEPAVDARPAQTEMRAVLKEGAVMSPQGVMYERFVVHHQIVLREQAAEIETLKATVAALIDRVARLETG